MEEPEKNSSDWIETAAKIAGAIGLNPVRVRWKLMAWREARQAARNRRGETVAHIRYQHRICPACGSVQDKSNRVCGACGSKLTPRFMEILQRAGIIAPQALSISSLLALAIAAIYARMVLSESGGGISFFQTDTLIRFGGVCREYVQGGEWWRLSTYIFLHGGLLHIAFNLIALMQVGPSLEEVFGRGRVLFIFMVTGIAAGLAQYFFLPSGVPMIGASGALMGLIGVAAGWGQRDGTRVGREIRNRMVNWAVYTVVFGWFIGAANWAHIGGFVAGALLGLFYKPKWERAPGFSLVTFFETLLGALSAAATVILIFFL
jgi:membrane associated rhomboid family serine protease